MFIFNENYDKKGNVDIQSIVEAGNRYRQYLHANAHVIDENAYKFALAKWKNDRLNRRSVHGAELLKWFRDDVNCSKFPLNEKLEFNGLQSLVLRWNGSFHDGCFETKYTGDVSCSYMPSLIEDNLDSFLWELDEILSGKNGKTSHEIRSLGDASLKISFDTFTYSWIPDAE